jgi:hypothetical protein
MTKAYFASAVAGTLLLGLATGANAATHRGELLAPAYAARGASVAADCSIHGQFNGSWGTRGQISPGPASTKPACFTDRPWSAK